MTKSLRLVGGNGTTIDLYPFLSASDRGSEALAGITGFGLMEQNNQWFQGAGNGKKWRNATIGSREIAIPLHTFGADATQLTTLLDTLAVAVDPTFGQSRLFFGLADGNEWWIDVVRKGKFDWARKVDSDDRTYFNATITLEAGDPFWTRSVPSSFEVRQVVVGQTLLPKFAELRVTSGAAFGVKQVENAGNTISWPTVQVNGPVTHVQLLGANGESLVWDGTLAYGETLYIDMRNSTVIDNYGANRYDGLATAPRFWSIAPGVSNVTVYSTGVNENSFVYMQWFPRRQAVI